MTTVTCNYCHCEFDGKDIIHLIDGILICDECYDDLHEVKAI